MFQKLCSYSSFFLFIFRNGCVFKSLWEQVKTFPGVTDSVKLRSWIRALLTSGNQIAATTQTKIDDVCVATALEIVDNNAAWNAVYRLIRLGNVFENDLTTDLSVQDVSFALGTITPEASDEEQEPKNPIVIINAIALIIQLIQMFRK